MNGHEFVQVAEARDALAIPARLVADDLLDDASRGRRWYDRLLDPARKLEVRTFLEYAQSRGVRDAGEALAVIEDE